MATVGVVVVQELEELGVELDVEDEDFDDVILGEVEDHDEVDLGA